MKKLADVDLSKWAFNPDGSVAFATLTGFECLPLEAGGVVVRLEVAAPIVPKTGTSLPSGNPQVALSTNQARKVAEILLAMADLVDRNSPAPPKPRPS